MFLKKLFREPRLKIDARSLYETAVRQARTAALYADHQVPDTVDGRFDMVILHVWLVLKRLKSAPAEFKSQQEKLGQAVFDTMIIDLDRNVREIGVSDVRVGKQMKAMGKAFYGRTAAYDEALADNSLPDTILRNIYGKNDGDRPNLEKDAQFLADYVQFQANYLAGQAFDGILQGKIAFSAEFGT